jgi:branched-chain amino acid transport system substrate-binding protein
MMEMKKSTLVIVIVLVGILCVALGYGVATYLISPSPPSSGPIKIGAVNPMTGSFSYFGNMMYRGHLIAQDEINAKGGVLGRYVSIVNRDDKSDAIEAVSAFRHLVTVDGTSCITGEASSAKILAMLPVAKEEEIVYLQGVGSNPKLRDSMGTGGNEWAFNTRPTDYIFVDAIVDFLIGKNWTTAYVLGQNTDFGRGAYDVFLVKYVEAGGTILGSDLYPSPTEDFMPYLTKIRNQNPDVVVSCAAMPDLLTLYKQYHQAEMQYPLVNRGNLLSSASIKTYGAGIFEGVYEYDTFYENIPEEWATQFSDKFTSAYGEFPSAAAFAGYYNVYVMCEAIKLAGSTDRTAIREAMTNLNVTLFGHTVKFDAYNQNYMDVWCAAVLNGTYQIIQKVPVQ